MDYLILSVAWILCAIVSYPIGLGAVRLGFSETVNQGWLRKDKAFCRFMAFGGPFNLIAAIIFYFFMYSKKRLTE